MNQVNELINKPLDEKYNKLYEEIYAKLILEYYFKNYYFDLIHDDKPDLFNEKESLGIEVTCGVDKTFLELSNLFFLILVTSTKKKR